MLKRTKRRSPPSRVNQVRFTLLAILGANWLVAALKTTLGVLNGSASVTADGMHSFVDGGSNIIGLVAMSIAARPADEDHPYGHGKFEALASLAIGALVGMAALKLGEMGIDALIYNRAPEVSPLLVVALLITLAVNAVVAAFERRSAQRLESSLLMADARHTLSDVFVTLAVLTSLGFSALGLPRVDGAVCLLVLVFVAWVAYGIVRQAVGFLSDTARLDPCRVIAVAAEVDGVRSVKDIRSRGMEESVYVDLKIEVDPSMSTAHAHALADAVERALSAAFPQVVDVVVHVEPAAGHTGEKADRSPTPLEGTPPA